MIQGHLVTVSLGAPLEAEATPPTDSEKLQSHAHGYSPLHT